MHDILQWLPFLIPIAAVQIALQIVALVHIFRHKNYRFGNRVLWVLLSFVQVIGPVLYFAVGRGED